MSDPSKKPLNEEAVFGIEKERFAAAVAIAIKVSKVSAGRSANLPHIMASYVFTRSCVTAETMLHLLERGSFPISPGTLDHFSVAVIARNIIEASIMTGYLLEDGVSDEQWALRGKILNLHDAIIKLRLFKAIGARDAYNEFKMISTDIRADIEKNVEFKKLSEERRLKIRGGHELYINGLRAALKQMDTDEKYFDGIYNYLSGQVHVSSNAFYDTDTRLGFGAPAPYQFYFAAFASAHARIFLLRSAIRIIKADDRPSDYGPPIEIEKIVEFSKVPFGAP